MKTIEIKLFKFEELSEEAKQKVLQDMYDINISYDWWESTYEDAKNIGLQITSFDLDRNRHAKGELSMPAIDVMKNIMEEHGENCDTYKTAAKYFHSWGLTLDEDLEDLEYEFLNDLLEDYSIILQKESEYLTSEEAIIESIEANDYDFTEAGKIY